MKIQPTSIQTPVSTRRAEGAPPKDEAAATSTEATKVVKSPEATFVGALREEAAATPKIRQDVVEDVKKSLADGTFESSVDMDNVIDGLMADL